MSNEGIEVKLVIDANSLEIPDVSDIVEDVVESTSFENAVDSMCEGWFENSNVYYHEDRLDTLESRLDDMESESYDEEDGDLRETVSALTTRHFALKDKVVALEEGDSFFTDVRYAHLKEAVSDIQEAFEEQDSKYDSIISDMEYTLNEWDFDQMQDDLNRDEEAIDDLKDRVNTLEINAEITAYIPEINDRLDNIEDKLRTDTTEEYAWESFQPRLLALSERVLKLEEINKRLMYIIHNIQGVDLP
tara:strand:+ start:3434 stop:4174 length:741 start_codon:yes stop_codon:yes gene_type:complete